MRDDDSPRPMTRAEVADFLGVKPHTISTYVSKGLLTPLRPAETSGVRRVYFDPKEVRRFLEEWGQD